MSQPPRRASSDSPQHFGKGLAGILARTEAYKTGNAAEPESTPPAEPAAAPALEMAPPPNDPPAPRRNQPPRHVAEQQNKPTGSGRVHPDRRGGLMLGTALATVRGGGVSNDNPISYYLPELIQATLPHVDPKTHVWVRKNGDVSLIVTSGFDSSGEAVGIPYGAFPRLVMAYIVTRVIAKPERKIELSSHFGTFLKEIGYVGHHWGNSPSAKRVKDQMMRLLNSRINFERVGGDDERGFRSVRNADIAPNFDLWWDFKQPEQDSLFGSWIELSEAFYNAILAHPVPLRTDILKALKKSPLALDVYMWASYRIFTIKPGENIEVSYGNLQAQFGTGIADENYRKFRQSLKIAFAKVAAQWKPPQGGQTMLNYEFTESSVILYHSPLTVPRGNRKTQGEEAAAMLAARKFDSKTRDRARVLAATRYTVDHLEEVYFAWIEQKKFTPADPPAHFLDFVEKHIKRNQ